ncbi:hypothetical protein [Metapseudomonas boanensis]|uniref:Uncharacterized protein n=1 Tax=Metapseudomonas boanensis TaxID=2822138 RepID=A0ABS5XFU2_9GAMM|nr:hypothetical protein [Pseudomonas boanensis]MBT8766561.1 hypothetical protein [Pseudomonas boanensis]
MAASVCGFWNETESSRTSKSSRRKYAFLAAGGSLTRGKTDHLGRDAFDIAENGRSENPSDLRELNHSQGGLLRGHQGHVTNKKTGLNHQAGLACALKEPRRAKGSIGAELESGHFGQL